jgi:hypothetical protein
MAGIRIPVLEGQLARALGKLKSDQFDARTSFRRHGAHIGPAEMDRLKHRRHLHRLGRTAARVKVAEARRLKYFPSNH